MKTYTIIPKFTAQDILDSINKEYTQLFEKVYDKWLDRDDKSSFLDPEILEWAEDVDDIEVID